MMMLQLSVEEGSFGMSSLRSSLRKETPYSGS